MDPAQQFVLATALQSLGLIGVVVGLYFTSRQIRLASQVAKDTLNWNKKTYTEDKLEKKPDPEKVIRLERIFATKDSVHAVPLKTILDEIERDPALALDIRYKLNRYERIARGIRVGVLDEQIVIDSLSVHMAKDYYNYRDYISYLQTSTPTGGLEEYAMLIAKWEDSGLPMLPFISRQLSDRTDVHTSVGGASTLEATAEALRR